MKVVGTDKIDKFSRKYDRSRKPLAEWLKKTRAAKWTKFADVKATFGTVDNPAGNEYIFNVGGNNFRLVALVVIVKETVLIKAIMTHEEYSKKYRIRINNEGPMGGAAVRKSCSKTRVCSVPADWNGLVTRTRPSLRPVTNDTEHAEAMEMLEKLAGVPAMNKAQSDFFEVLSDLIAKYEARRWFIDTAGISVIDVLKSLMDDHKMNASDLGRLLGNDRTLGYKILTGKRKLTTEQIKILADTFKVSTDLFIE